MAKNRRGWVRVWAIFANPIHCILNLVLKEILAQQSLRPLDRNTEINDTKMCAVYQNRMEFYLVSLVNVNAIRTFRECTVLA